ncbi:MAG: hypothetical protein GWN79_22835 [Actinobacteria bacterium]|nr:hypothetical protein [Actinomycetota bacterium]NIS35372.1 hypothetical protein [Actinomycetota bacterium]NIT98087.1 hypothetical protein [Actinomycetota bacterium]NIU21722.1 hypothetical protein [Actinomycetota bacterium]NIU70064.1 hypothetical protein [Actinomycetota bacterium]
MQSFRRFGESDDPWFRVGEVAVTTTMAVAATSIFYMFVWAFEPRDRPITSKLWLASKDVPFSGSVLEGEIWRLVTWPVAMGPSIWTVLLVVIFFMLGSQLEAVMGRIRFTAFLGTLTIVPALVVTVLEFTGLEGGANGLRFLEIGVLVAFAAHIPRALFWPGIPAWAIAAIIFGIETLQFIDLRDDYSLTLLFVEGGLALLLIRSMGLAEEVTWMPKVPLPRILADPYRQRAPRRARPARRRNHLSSVPPPPSVADQVAQAEIDALLDKVAEQGMDSLTRAERKALEEHSKRLRKRRGD